MYNISGEAHTITSHPQKRSRMVAQGGKHEVLERGVVAPLAAPPTPNTTTHVPLTFFDISWAGPITVKNAFFYKFPHSTNHFIETTLPSLKHTLSLTLQHFFPLAGNLLFPPPPHKPFIRYTPKDSVTLIVLESSADLKHLVANHPRGLQEFDHLIPELSLLPRSCVENDDKDTLVFPLLSLKITVFPCEGLCIGATYHHVFDGKSFAHFIKSWSSVCLNNGDLACLEKSLPYFGRDVVRDPKGLETIFLQEYFKRPSDWKDTLRGLEGYNDANDEDIVRLTLAIGAKDSDKFKEWVSTQCKIKNEPSPTNLSRLMVTCALLWISLVKCTRGSLDHEHQEEEECLLLQADCRNRLGYPLPSTYIGSCLAPVPVLLKKKDLLGEQGFVAAIKVIDGELSRMKSDPLESAEKWMTEFYEMIFSGHIVIVAGSPKFGLYETDFGFGRPTKVEMITGLNIVAFVDSENDEDEGGMEVGLTLRRSEVERFVSVFEQELKAHHQID